MRCACLLVATLSVFVFASPGVARSYSLNRVEVTAQVRSDGLMHVTELREIAFEGTFHAFDREIPLRAGESIRNVSVSEHDEEYRRDESKSPGTYHISYTSPSGGGGGFSGGDGGGAR